MKAGKSAKSGGMAKGGNADQVKAVQQALKDKGHDPGSVDGVMGPKTRSALKEGSMVMMSGSGYVTG